MDECKYKQLGVPKPRTRKRPGFFRYFWMVAVFLVFVAVPVGVLISIQIILTHEEPSEGWIQKCYDGFARQMDSSGQAIFKFCETTSVLTVFNSLGKAHNLSLGLGADSELSPQSCSSSHSQVCLDFGDQSLTIIPESDKCIQVGHVASGRGVGELKHCIDLGSGHWYGLGEIYNQKWPIEKWSQKLSEFVTGDMFSDRFGGVIERYLLSSAGVAIHVDFDVPLFVSVNDSGSRQICLVSKFAPPYQYADTDKLTLNYTVCTGTNMTELHTRMAAMFWKKPQTSPHPDLFRYPIWSTWVMYSKGVTQGDVSRLVQQISNYDLPSAQIEIDDNWTPKYGDFQFDSTKFPNASFIITILKNNGFHITLWMHPFFNLDSEAFQMLTKEGYLVKDTRGVVPSLVSWWNSDGTAAGLLDITNPKAVEWYLNQTQSLKNTYGIDSFKFDAGETNWLPPSYKLMNGSINPDIWAIEYVKMCHRSDSSYRQEVRIGCRTQEYGMMVRMIDKTSVWGSDNGLKTIIPAVLTFGLLGYPYVLPDMVGGNTGFPDAELFIRWVQVNVFLPTIQISTVPWKYNDTQVMSIFAEMLALREKYSNLLLQLADESKATGWPIVRPLWWVAPDDPHAQAIDDQFLVGNDLLVAPMLESYMNHRDCRDIYLPEGQWRDAYTLNIINGSSWLRCYRILLNKLPFFTRV